MYKTFINTFKFSFVERANIFIYFLKRVPIIKNKIPESLYGYTDIKQKIGVICVIFTKIMEFFYKGLYVGIMVILPAWLIKKLLIQDTDIIKTSIYIFFWTSFIIGSSNSILNPNKQAFNMINLMRVEPKKYYLGQLVYKLLSQLIFFMPPMLILGLSLSKAIILLLELSMFRILAEWIYIYIYEKKNIMILGKRTLLITGLLVCLIFAYLIPSIGLLNFDIQKILFNTIFFITILILSVGGGGYLWIYKGYTKIAKKLVTKERILSSETQLGEARFIDVKIDSSKMDSEALNCEKFKNKKRYDYLNSIFFVRHKKIVKSEIKTRSIVICICSLIILIIALVMPTVRPKILKYIESSMAFLVFIMYAVSITEKICKAMFFNCDIGLLRYGYYRQGKAILSNFRIRLKKVMLFNLIPATVLCTCILILAFICTNEISNLFSLIPMCLCIILLSCFFSIHHLFMYYVLQPYTADLDIKSPLFKFVNSGMYFICYIFSRIKTNSIYFIFGIMIETIIYSVVALSLVCKLAPKTFKLK